MWRRAFLIILSSLLLMVSTTLAAQEAYLSDLVIFANPDSLTLYVAYDEDVSLEGFQFGVFQGETYTLLSPNIRFNVLTAQKNILKPDTCLFYRYTDGAVPPPVCDTGRTFISDVGPHDAFWLDDKDQRVDLYVLKNGDSTGESCPMQEIECPVYFSISVPDIRDANDLPVIPNYEISITPRYSDTNLDGDRGPINQVAWSADRDEIITAHSNGDICLWNPNRAIATSYTTCQDNVHSGGVSAIAWKPGDNPMEFATAGLDGIVSLWQVEDQQLVRLQDLPHTGSVYSLVWHPNENQLATAIDGRLLIWDVDNLQTPPRTFNINNPRFVDWRHDGRYLLTMDDQSIVRIVDTSREEEFAILDYYEAGQGKRIAWQPQFGQWGSLTGDGTLRLYAYEPGLVCNEQSCPSTLLAQNLPGATQFAFSPDGKLVAVTLEGEVHVLNAQEPYYLLSKYVVRDNPDASFTAVAWNADGQRLVAADNQGNIHVWQVGRQESPQRLEPVETWLASPDNSSVLAIAWDPNGGGLADVDSRLQVFVWDLQGNQIGRNLAHRERPLTVDWNLEQRVIATGGCGPLSIVWELNARPAVEIKTEEDDTNCATAIAFNPSGTILATADQSGIISLWDWALDATRPVAVKELTLEVNDIAWDSNGSQLASVDQYGLIEIFEVSSNYQFVEVMARQPELGVSVNSLAWSPDNSYLATASDGGWVAIWRLADAELQARKPFADAYLLWGHDGPVVSVSWSPNNNWLATAGADGHLMIWDALTGQRLADLELDNVPVQVSWAPVGATIAVADKAGFITLFDFNF